MPVTASTLIGTLAMVASVTSFTPQAWQIIKTRKTADISAGMYALTVAGFALWLAYGVILGHLPMIAANGICLVLAAFILVMKLLPRAEKQAVADHLDPATDRPQSQDVQNGT